MVLDVVTGTPPDVGVDTRGTDDVAVEVTSDTVPAKAQMVLRRRAVGAVGVARRVVVDVDPEVRARRMRWRTSRTI